MPNLVSGVADCLRTTQPDAAADFAYNDPWLGVQNRFHDMHAFHPNYMFNANEVTDEYNLLNDFLSNSLFEETGMYSTEEFQGAWCRGKVILWRRRLVDPRSSI